MDLIRPDWPAPASVHAATTTRQGGYSEPPYSSLNLAAHVGDAVASVARNRALLASELELPSEPVWLTQVHGDTVIDAGRASPPVTGADASFTTRHGSVCAVLTADCLPVLFCDRAAGCVAAAHAGWRGLLGGVLEATVKAMPVSANTLLAWMGPAIGPDEFEVGEDVRNGFLQYDRNMKQAFRPGKEGRWFADLYQLGRMRLEAAGVAAIYGGGECTVRDKQRFYSYRRNGSTGRMASLIWLAGGA